MFILLYIVKCKNKNNDKFSKHFFLSEILTKLSQIYFDLFCFYEKCIKIFYQIISNVNNIDTNICINLEFFIKNWKLKRIKIHYSINKKHDHENYGLTCKCNSIFVFVTNDN